MKIATRLILLLVTAVVSVMAVYALKTISSTKDRLDDEMHKMAEHIGLALSVGTLHHLKEGDVEGVFDVLEAISANEDVIGAAIFDINGNLVASSRSIAKEVTGTTQDYTNTQGIYRHEGSEDNPQYAYICGIQDADGEMIGSLRLVLRERSMLPYVLSVRNQILITIFVLTTVLSILVFYVSTKQIADPLKALTKGVEAFGRGELSHRITLKGSGELVALAETFNRMADNLTNWVRFEKQIQQSEKLAAVGQLAAGVAHEIGTPLNVISGSAEYLLMDANPDDPKSEELKTIVSEVGRISDLVKRLMAFSRQKEPQIEPINVGSLVDSVLVLLRRQMEKQSIKIQVDLPDHLPEISGDRDQIQQVLLNLIMNAWQAMPGGGQLSISATVNNTQEKSEKASNLKLTISDTGYGIPEGHLQRIFEPFFTTKEIGKGTGLGLAIAHRIVEDHGGRIAVSSAEGKGSTFAIELPVEQGV